MSLRVMRMKAKNKTLMAEANARQGNTFALGFTRTGIKQGACCEGGIHIKSIPSHQQSYSLYLKRATMGIGGSGGLASRVVDFPPNSGGTKGTFQKMLTFKRPQKFTTSNYIENKKSKAIRCAVMDKCDGSAPAPETDKICYNNCSNKPCITEDLGYDDASDQINRRVAMRAGPSLTANYESEMMRNNGQSGCN